MDGSNQGAVARCHEEVLEEVLEEVEVVGIRERRRVDIIQ